MTSVFTHFTLFYFDSAILGDEYSTIARLTEYKHDHQSYTNNNSMVDSSMYSVHRMDVDTSMFSLSGADATPARQESQVYNLKLCVLFHCIGLTRSIHDECR